MPKRTCTADDCARTPHARGLCSMHYARMLRHGTTEAPQRQRHNCTVDGCGRQSHALGYCAMHYRRVRKTGDPFGLLQAPAGSGTVTPLGYRMVFAPGHPIAGRRRQVFEHRVVLYDAIGPGSHPCHWCAKVVDWGASVPDPEALVVDHIDGDPSNNHLANLVPSCISCNSRRANGCRLDPASTAVR